MARNCLSACALVKKGKWTIEDVENWLKAVIDGDARYLNEVVPLIAEKLAAKIDQD